ncbi:MAG: HAMP domain-containing sensor histidine kinase [Eubacteriales bacterium]|nr:HAMP domain-containing sensor histidine kinase [Eubacteriales bacterium]
MIKALRRKFVLTAMLSLFILLVILISCIIAFGYYSMERSADTALEIIANGRFDFEPGQEPQPDPIFGYQSNQMPPQDHFMAIASAEHEVLSVSLPAILQLDEDEASAYAQTALDSGKTSGKTGPYKYLITEQDDGTLKITFLDNSIQAHMLLDIFRGACLVGFLCLLLMFVIVMLISGKAVHPFAENMEKQRQFITNAGHEIKTPLAIIMTNTDALELHQGTSKWSQNIRNQAIRMNGLMKQLLLLARADEQTALMDTELLPFSKLTRNVVASFEESALQKHLTVETNIADNILLQGNADGIEQLLHLLLDNAIKYTPENGWISLGLTDDGKRKRLTVRNSLDTLPSVPPSTLFDRFYRADPARSQKNGGYGIGLSVAKAIAEQHHGKLRAAYENGPAICFTLELP